MKKKFVIFAFLMVVLNFSGNASAVMFNGHDYQVVQYAWHSWESATSNVTAVLGSDYYLATITSQEENDFIASLIKGGEYWLGGFQYPNTFDPDANWNWVNSEGVFYNNGSTGMYENWSSGEANDYFGRGTEQYLAMWGSTGKWNDEGALSNITGYIAENGAAPVPEPATMILLGSGLICLTAFTRKFKKA